MPHIKFYLSVITALMLLAIPSFAQDVWITPETPFVELELDGNFFVIERNPDSNAVVPAAFAKTSRACPPFCIQPIAVAEGVKTIGELELLTFLENEAQSGEGLLIDARTPRFYQAGTIPGSVSLPFNLLTPNDTNPFLEPILALLGAKKQSDNSWDFTNANKLALFCNGPWCGQSPRAIRNLISVGYPAEKLLYYRGGMQNWLMLGLTVVVPET